MAQLDTYQTSPISLNKQTLIKLYLSFCRVKQVSQHINDPTIHSDILAHVRTTATEDGS
jgi:hypothetical protein